MDGFSNVTTVTVDDPLGNQLADAMDGLRCSRSTRAVQPSVVPQQTVRQQKVVEELADSMVSPFLPRNASTGGWGWPFPVWLGVRLRLHCCARTARHHVPAPSHRAWSPSHPPRTASAAAPHLALLTSNAAASPAAHARRASGRVRCRWEGTKALRCVEVTWVGFLADCTVGAEEHTGATSHPPTHRLPPASPPPPVRVLPAPLSSPSSLLRSPSELPARAHHTGA